MGEPTKTPTPAVVTPTKRVAAIDAFRGLVMFLMMAEVLHLLKPRSALDEPDLVERVRSVAAQA